MNTKASTIGGAVLVGLVVVITLLFVRKIYRSFLGRERAPVYWILGRLFGGDWGGHLGNELDGFRPPAEGTGPNWGAVIFWCVMLVGWLLLVRAWSAVG